MLATQYENDPKRYERGSPQESAAYVLQEFKRRAVGVFTSPLTRAIDTAVLAIHNLLEESQQHLREEIEQYGQVPPEGFIETPNTRIYISEMAQETSHNSDCVSRWRTYSISINEFSNMAIIDYNLSIVVIKIVTK